MAVAVVDIGKSNLKLVALGEGGETLQAARLANRVLPGPPFPHHDTDGHWRWLLEALSALPDKTRIEAVVPVTHGATAALMAGEDLALPVLDYEHAGPEEVADAFRAAADPFGETCSPDLPIGLNLGRQIFWQQARFPDAFATVTDILPYPQYWAFRLSGVKASEVTSLGCHTHLWNPGEVRYSGLVERQGWSGRFPPMRLAWETLGPIRPEVAAATGLSPSCRVICGIHDSNASLLAYLGRCAPPLAVVSSGTWVIAMAPGGEVSRLDPVRDMLAGVDAAGRAVPTARYMGGREYELIAGEAAPDMAALAGLLAEGLMVLPSLVPESGPFIGRTGGVVGALPADPPARATLASLYSALMIDLLLDLLAAKGPVFIDGPFAANRLIPALLATLRPDQEVRADAQTSGPADGAALLAAWPGAATAGTSAPIAALAGQREALLACRRLWRQRLASGRPGTTPA